MRKKAMNLKESGETYNGEFKERKRKKEILSFKYNPKNNKERNNDIINRVNSGTYWEVRLCR